MYLGTVVINKIKTLCFKSLKQIKDRYLQTMLEEAHHDFLRALKKKKNLNTGLDNYKNKGYCRVFTGLTLDIH